MRISSKRLERERERQGRWGGREEWGREGQREKERIVLV
jgi:hypothetical protein